MKTRREFFAGLGAVLAGVAAPKAAKASTEPQRRSFRHGIIRLPLSLSRWKGNHRVPPGAKTISVSEHVFFCTNELAIKVEHPALPATLEGDVLPTVKAVYSAGGKFVRWEILSR